MNDVLKKLIEQKIADTLVVNSYNSELVVSVNIDHSGMTADAVAKILIDKCFAPSTKIHLVVNGQKIATKRSSAKIPRLPNTLTARPSFGNLKKVVRSIFKEPNPYQALQEGARTSPINWTALSKDPLIWDHPRILKEFRKVIKWSQAIKHMPIDLNEGFFFSLFTSREFWHAMRYAEDKNCLTFAQILAQHIDDPRLQANHSTGFDYITWIMPNSLQEAFGIETILDLGPYKGEQFPLMNKFWIFKPELDAYKDDFKWKIASWVINNHPEAIPHVHTDWKPYFI